MVEPVRAIRHADIVDTASRQAEDGLPRQHLFTSASCPGVSYELAYQAHRTELEQVETCPMSSDKTRSRRGVTSTSGCREKRLPIFSDSRFEAMGAATSNQVAGATDVKKTGRSVGPSLGLSLKADLLITQQEPYHGPRKAHK
jgi:hypothetical protein